MALSAEDLTSPCGSREEIVRIAFEAVGTTPRVLHMPRPLLVGIAGMLRPVHPHLGEVTGFVARALTSDFVAPPPTGHRTLRDHFAAAARGTAHAARGLR